MNKSETKIYFLFTVISFVFVVATTDYLNLFDIIHIANQMDVISYSEISKNAPILPNQSDVIIKHVAQRFLIPYTVGSIANLFNIDLAKISTSSIAGFTLRGGLFFSASSNCLSRIAFAANKSS